MMALMRFVKLRAENPISGDVRKKIVIKHICMFKTVWQGFPRFLVVSIMKMLLEMELMVF